MAEFALQARAPLDIKPTASRADAGVTLSLRPDGRQAILIARGGRAEALAERGSGLGVMLPKTPQRVESRGLGVVWIGPGQWLVDWEEREANRAEQLFTSFASLCSVVRADDARARIAIRGPRARDVLAKMLPVDLHPRAFKPGAAAVTVAGSIAVILWQSDDGPTFVCAVPRSLARSFWEWLVDSAGEYGVAVEGLPPRA